MARLFLRNPAITKDTREQDVINCPLVVPDIIINNEGHIETLSFIKEDMEPLTPGVTQVINIELGTEGGFIAMTVDEAKHLLIDLQYAVNRYEVHTMPYSSSNVK